jgi:AraC-like DNA-binding protein
VRRPQNPPGANRTSEPGELSTRDLHRRAKGDCVSIALGTTPVALRPYANVAWIADNLSRRHLSTSALADRVSMSVRNFGRVFTADVGTTPAKYVLHLRVEAARRLLQSSSHDLRYIATAVGFGSVDGMRRAFVRVLGKSPREMCAPKAKR